MKAKFNWVKRQCHVRKQVTAHIENERRLNVCWRQPTKTRLTKCKEIGLGVLPRLTMHKFIRFSHCVYVHCKHTVYTMLSMKHKYRYNSLTLAPQFAAFA